MPNNVKTVNLTPRPDGAWHPVPPVQLPPNSGSWLVSFELTGNHAQTQNVTFKSNDPIWIRPHQKPDQSNKTDAQIAGAYVTPDGKNLVVLDLNNNDSNQGEIPLHYQLNFNNYGALDPIIENGGKPLIEAMAENDLSTALSTVKWNAEAIGITLLVLVVLLVIGGAIGRALKA